MLCVICVLVHLALNDLITPIPFIYIFMYRRENPRAADAREAFKKNRSVSEALNLFSGAYKQEALLLSGMKQVFGDRVPVSPATVDDVASWEADWQMVFRQLPHSQRTMYVHAWQSHIWNTLASKRIEAAGAGGPTSVQAGDLVKVDEIENENGKETHADAPAKCKVRRVTKEDIQCGRYSMSDIVLPLPGNGIELFPSHGPTTREDYERELHKQGLSFDAISFKHQKSRDCRLKGVYRHVVAKPIQGSIKFQIACRGKRDEKDENEEDEEGTGKLPPIIVQFALQKSSYATMVIRELTRLNFA